jgi:hypothetical protein
MKTVKRGVHGLFALLVAAVLLFGANQALASNDGAAFQYCPGTCPPETPSSCWDLCVEHEYFGGDCDPLGDCCCVDK